MSSYRSQQRYGLIKKSHCVGLRRRDSCTDTQMTVSVRQFARGSIVTTGSTAFCYQTRVIVLISWRIVAGHVGKRKGRMYRHPDKTKQMTLCSREWKHVRTTGAPKTDTLWPLGGGQCCVNYEDYQSYLHCYLTNRSIQLH